MRDQATRPKFFILSLPRSRSTWLSHFLSYPPKRCGHDIAAESSSIQNFLGRLSVYDGACETGAIVGWPLIRRFVPDAQIIVIRRPVAQVMRSLRRFGIIPVEGEIEARAKMLDACIASPGVRHFEYDELDNASVCRWIFETCLGLPFDAAWYEDMAKRNIQVDVPEQMRQLWDRRSTLTRFKAEVAQAMGQTSAGQPCPAL